MRCDDVKAVTIYARFRIGDIVYLRLAKEKRDGMVIGLNVRPPGTTYLVSWPDGEESSHYDLELTTEFIPDYTAPNSDD